MNDNTLNAAWSAVLPYVAQEHRDAVIVALTDALEGVAPTPAAVGQGEVVTWQWREKTPDGWSEWMYLDGRDHTAYTNNALFEVRALYTHTAAVREGEYPSDEEMDAIEDARDEAEMFPPAAVREVTAEYIAARDAYEEATRPLASHGPIRTLKHGDPIVLRYRAARAALSRDGVEDGA